MQKSIDILSFALIVPISRLQA